MYSGRGGVLNVCWSLYDIYKSLLFDVKTILLNRISIVQLGFESANACTHVALVGKIHKFVNVWKLVLNLFKFDTILYPKKLHCEDKTSWPKLLNKNWCDLGGG